MKKFLIYIGVLSLLMSCTHKDLCYLHEPHAHKYHLEISADYRCEWEENLAGYCDWREFWPSNYLPYDSLRPHVPEGLRVVSYSEDGTQRTSNIAAHGGTVYLAAGLNDLLFYNNDTEYIVFIPSESIATTRATTRSVSRASYNGNPFATGEYEEMTVNPPDMLYGNYIENYFIEKTEIAERVEVTLQPLVFTYMVRFEFSAGLEYVALARGTLAGMAHSVELSTGTTSYEAATILYDCDVTDWGCEAYVNSFGVPGYPNPNYTRASGTFAVNLEVRLRNGKYKSFDFDVTDQVVDQPHGGVIVIDGLEITADEGSTSGGAFDVTVNDWEEYEDVEIPLL